MLENKDKFETSGPDVVIVEPMAVLDEAVTVTDTANTGTIDAGEPLPDKPKEQESSLADSIITPVPMEESTEETLAEVKEPEEMDVLGNGKLLKKVLHPGAGGRPNPGDKITVTFSVEIDNGPVVDKNDKLTFILGDGDYLQAFDLCCSLMELDEVARVTTEPAYAYGTVGRKPDIPANVRLIYEIHLIENHGPIDYTAISLEERIQEADQKRERGNFHYSRMEYSGAINSYSKAISVLDAQSRTLDGSPEDLQKVLEMKVKCNNNLAASQLKVEIYDAAIKSCNAVLSVQPDNVKALFRKGKCYAAMGDVKSAIVAMKKALKYASDSKIIHNELSHLANRQRGQEERERAMYARMMGTETPKKTKREPVGWLNNWAWAAGAAGAAIAISLGITAYRYFHL